jgi:IclR family transcriptional regulator, acetate operon repressor
MRQRKTIQSIERATALLEIIAREGGSARLQFIAEKAGIRCTTAHNILATLEALGYVRRSIGDVRYHLGDRILNLARIIGDDNTLRKRLRPTLEAIARKASETVYLAVPSGDEVYYLDAIESPQSLKVCSPIGRREQLEGSAIGLVFLAFIPGLRKRVLATRSEALGPGICDEIESVARRGYGLDIDGYQQGQSCVAVPFYEGGQVRASFGLSGPSSRLNRDTLVNLAWTMTQEVTLIRRAKDRTSTQALFDNRQNSGAAFPVENAHPANSENRPTLQRN